MDSTCVWRLLGLQLGRKLRLHRKWQTLAGKFISSLPHALFLLVKLSLQFSRTIWGSLEPLPFTARIGGGGTCSDGNLRGCLNLGVGVKKEGSYKLLCSSFCSRESSFPMFQFLVLFIFCPIFIKMQTDNFKKSSSNIKTAEELRMFCFCQSRPVSLNWCWRLLF